MRPASPRIAFAWLVLALLSFGWIACVVRILPARPPERFDPSRWRRTEVEQRRPLAGQFLDEYAAAGITRSRLVSLLGAPDEENRVWRYRVPRQGQPNREPRLEIAVLFAHLLKLVAHPIQLALARPAEVAQDLADPPANAAIQIFVELLLEGPSALRVAQIAQGARHVRPQIRVGTLKQILKGFAGFAVS